SRSRPRGTSPFFHFWAAQPLRWPCLNLHEVWLTPPDFIGIVLRASPLFPDFSFTGGGEARQAGRVLIPLQVEEDLIEQGLQGRAHFLQLADALAHVF